MRVAALLLALAVVPTGGSGSLAIEGVPALSFDGGHATFLAMEGFGVLALTTAPLVDGAWATPDDSAFVYAEVRVFGGIAEGELPLGQRAGLTVQRWEADGSADDALPSFLDAAGTLTFTSVTDSLAVGTMEGTLTQIDLETGETTDLPFSAAFEAVPGQIPAP